MKDFFDLVFVGNKKRSARLDLGNNIEISVIGGEGCYGNGETHFEIAFFYRGKLAPIDLYDDVLGWQSKEEVSHYMELAQRDGVEWIRSLEARREQVSYEYS